MGKYDELAALAVERGQHDDVRMILSNAMEHIREVDSPYYSTVMSQLEALAYRIPLADAERIVKSMRPRGQNWSYEQVKDYIASKEIEDNCVAWYLVLNMVYNDYYETAKTFGFQNDVEFYFSLARDFINDPDGRPYKVEKYFAD